jgi:hypothetical protein
MNGRPDATEYAPFYAGYVSLVPESDVIPVLEQQSAVLERQARQFVPSLEQHRYAPGKWSVREVIGHIIDAERVFGFRAFCFSRGEANPLPGFEQNDYVATGGFDGRSLVDLVDEFAQVRLANLIVLKRLDGDAWKRVGTASGRRVSVRALAYIMGGHVRHHMSILSSHYAAGTESTHD